MEVSSHAAHQHRIAGLHFTGGIFTNLTRDHLDYHKTVEAYLQAKKSFFDDLPSTAFALTNADDKTGLVMLQNTLAKKYTYSLRTQADYTCRIIESRLAGTLLSLNGREVHTLFTGRFNAYNLTAVYGACLLVGLDPEKTIIDMSQLVPVAGRFQTFHSPSGAVTAIVDYAHTPDAVVNVLTAIRDVVGRTGNIITVVGAGGNRDKGKRPIMAAEAARLSDRVVLTSDNPRDEVPEDIIRDMEAGLTDESRPRTLSITDRREAINAAVALAAAGDVVLIAGKCHEDYQEVHCVKHHFDDREVVAEALKNAK
ncbi:MAG: UDP-N-acetylmuramoyl-L-alanyl-D-glutamate--2,6-diaminopimelate ligase, partial [Paramuribaculum sp.]|nr:UDP-N-acetylmuramoyl-L-alanyl-D-glutamate--2,6-diaminopimelate ligase [Paramuribaculum sp.]